MLTEHKPPTSLKASTPSFWKQVPKNLKVFFYIGTGIIFLVIVYFVLSWYRNRPINESNHSIFKTTAPAQTNIIRASDYLHDGIKSTYVTITEEITLDQDVPYSSVTNMDPIFCDGKPIDSQGSWGGYKRFRILKPQLSEAKLLLVKP